MRNRSGDLHPSRHLSQFGARPKRRERPPVAVTIIDLLRKNPRHPAAATLIDELLKLRGLSTLPLDVRAIVLEHGKGTP